MLFTQLRSGDRSDGDQLRSNSVHNPRLACQVRNYFIIRQARDLGEMIPEPTGSDSEDRADWMDSNVEIRMVVRIAWANR